MSNVCVICPACKQPTGGYFAVDSFEVVQILSEHERECLLLQGMINFFREKLK